MSISVGVVYERRRKIENTYLWPTLPANHVPNIHSLFFLATRNQILFGTAMCHAQLKDYDSSKPISTVLFPFSQDFLESRNGHVTWIWQWDLRRSGSEGVYKGHSPREVFAFLIKGDPLCSAQPSWDHKATNREMKAYMLRMKVPKVRKSLGPGGHCWAGELRTLFI